MAEQNAPQTPAPATTPADEPNSGLGNTLIDETVVAKIAGLAAHEVTGVYRLGGGAARAVGALRESLGAAENYHQGITVEVGERQAAVDILIVAEYGVAIHEMAEAVRINAARAIERMTGLEVTEVNVTVTDIHLPDEDGGDDESRSSRVR
mgnify:FL=1